MPVWFWIILWVTEGPYLCWQAKKLPWWCHKTGRAVAEFCGVTKDNHVEKFMKVFVYILFKYMYLFSKKKNKLLLCILSLHFNPECLKDEWKEGQNVRWAWVASSSPFLHHKVHYFIHSCYLREQLSFNQTLRQQQDEAYLESLRTDQEKVMRVFRSTVLG